MVHIKLLTAFVLFLGFIAGACAQQNEWNDLYQRAKNLYREGRYAEGVEVAGRALKMATKSFGPDHTNVAVSLNQQALLLRAQKRYAEAEPLYKLSLEIYEKALVWCLASGCHNCRETTD
jgi:tetratricopeptide (TPR) repeat protein